MNKIIILILIILIIFFIYNSNYIFKELFETNDVNGNDETTTSLSPATTSMAISKLDIGVLQKRPHTTSSRTTPSTAPMPPSKVDIGVLQTRTHTTSSRPPTTTSSRPPTTTSSRTPTTTSLTSSNGDTQYVKIGQFNFKKIINNSNIRDLLEEWFTQDNIDDPSGWDVSEVTNMKDLFKNIDDINFELNNWDTSNVTDMSGMFYGCSNFNKDISSWDTSNVTDMSGMFYGCSNFNQDIGGWVLHKIKNMSNMFNSATKFNMDISKWDINDIDDSDSALNINGMFDNASAFLNSGKKLNNWALNEINRNLLLFWNLFEEENYRNKSYYIKALTDNRGIPSYRMKQLETYIINNYKPCVNDDNYNEKIISFININNEQTYEFIKISENNKLIIKIPHFIKNSQHHLSYNDTAKWSKDNKQDEDIYKLFEVIKISDRVEYTKKMTNLKVTNNTPSTKINQIFNLGLGIYLISPKNHPTKFIKIDNKLTIESIYGNTANIEKYFFYGCI